VANRILSDLDLQPHGHQLMAMNGGRRQHNSAIVMRLLHAAINEAVGMDSNIRAEWTREQLTTIFEPIDDLGDALRDSLRTQLSERG